MPKLFTPCACALLTLTRVVSLLVDTTTWQSFVPPVMKKTLEEFLCCMLCAAAAAAAFSLSLPPPARPHKISILYAVTRRALMWASRIILIFFSLAKSFYDKKSCSILASNFGSRWPLIESLSILRYCQQSYTLKNVMTPMGSQRFSYVSGSREKRREKKRRNLWKKHTSGANSLMKIIKYHKFMFRLYAVPSPP